MLGGDEDDIMGSLASNSHVGQNERLGINVAIHRVAEYPAEAVHVDVREGEVRFVRVQAGASEVVVLHEDRDGAPGAKRVGEGEEAAGEERNGEAELRQPPSARRTPPGASRLGSSR